MEETESDLQHNPPHCVVACIEALTGDCPSWLEPYARNNRGDMDHVGGMIALALDERGLAPLLCELPSGSSISQHLLKAKQTYPNSFRGILYQSSDLQISLRPDDPTVQLHVVAALPDENDPDACLLVDTLHEVAVRKVDRVVLDAILPDLPEASLMGFVVCGLSPEDPQASEPELQKFVESVRGYRATIRT